MKPLATIVLIVLVAGCQEPTAHYNRTKVAVIGQPGAARPVSTVALYQTEAEVPGPYVRLAIFSVEGHAGDEAQFMQAFLYHGAALGADAVIFTCRSLVSTREGGMSVSGQNGGLTMPSNPVHDAVYHGEAIRFTSHTPASPNNHPTETPTKPQIAPAS